MKRHKDFINEEVFFDTQMSDQKLVSLFETDPYKGSSLKELEDDYKLLIGRDSELSDKLREKGEKFTFGILKAIFHDAIHYKTRREFKKGTFKFLHRVIPMALASIFLPLTILKTVLGTSRLFNKVLTPVLNNPTSKYPDFLKKIIMNTMSIVDGDYRIFMEKDWFYGIFFIDQGLKDLIKKEHLIEFGVYLADKMSTEPDDKEVPKGYVQHELKMYIQEKFKVTIQEDIRIHYD